MREVTKEEYEQIYKDMEYKAAVASDNVIDTEWFLSNESVPCLYSDRQSIKCPRTGEVVTTREAPEGYRWDYKPDVWYVDHLSTTHTCLELVPGETEVECLAEVGPVPHSLPLSTCMKYYHCFHKVGECPHKE